MRAERSARVIQRRNKPTHTQIIRPILSIIMRYFSLV